MTDSQKTFLIAVYQAAKHLEIDPIFTAAQAMLESGWGKSKIGKYNIFGVTKGSWTGKTILVKTTEYFKNGDKVFKAPEKVISKQRLAPSKWEYKVYRLFRDYDSLEQALADHEAIFKKPMYADAWRYKDNALMFARKITDAMGAKYATSPVYYNSLRKMIIQITPLCQNL